MTVPMIMTADGFTVYLEGRQYDVHRSHRNYETLKTAIRDGDYELFKDRFNISEKIQQQAGGKVEVRGGTVYYNGKPIHNTLTERMIQMMDEGFDISPMTNFFENLMDNPSYRAVQELYTFLEKCSLPITPEGNFLAYKNVRENFTDIFSGTFDNSPGAVCEMARNEVDEDKDRTCSKGLHFCSIHYLPYFGSGPGNRTVIVEINPQDVVSIPSDYNNAKGRTCRYKVVGEHFGRENKEAFRKTVHALNENGMTYGDPDSRLDVQDALVDELEMLTDTRVLYESPDQPALWHRMPHLDQLDPREYNKFMSVRLGVDLTRYELAQTVASIDFATIKERCDQNYNMIVEMREEGTGEVHELLVYPRKSEQTSRSPGATSTGYDPFKVDSYLASLSSLRQALNSKGMTLKFKNPTTGSINTLPGRDKISQNEKQKFYTAELYVETSQSRLLAVLDTLQRVGIIPNYAPLSDNQVKVMYGSRDMVVNTTLPVQSASAGPQRDPITGRFVPRN